MEINEEMWNNGVSVDGDKEEKILEVLEEVDGKGGIDMEGIGEKCGLKWVYGSIKKLFDGGKVERKKIGKKYFYRLVR